jgi:hypothetical protein
MDREIVIIHLFSARPTYQTFFCRPQGVRVGSPCGEPSELRRDTGYRNKDEAGGR